MSFEKLINYLASMRSHLCQSRPRLLRLCIPYKNSLEGLQVNILMQLSFKFIYKNFATLSNLNFYMSTWVFLFKNIHGVKLVSLASKNSSLPSCSLMKSKGSHNVLFHSIVKISLHFDNELEHQITSPLPPSIP